MSTKAAKLLLLLVFLSRGSSYIFSKIILTELSPFLATGYRFALACLILVILYHKRIWQQLQQDRKLLRNSVILGALLFLMMVFELSGLKAAAVHTVALVESSSIILVPLLLSLFYRTLPTKKIFWGTILIFSGIFLLNMTPAGFVFTGGEILAFCSALSYALYVIFTGILARKSDAFVLGILQMGVIGLLSFLAALLFQGNINLPVQQATWQALLIQVLLCSCFGFTFQPVAQRYISSEEANLFGAIGPLFATLLGHFVFGEVLGLTGTVGTVLIMIGLLYGNKV